jgi:hypothetical protein
MNIGEVANKIDELGKAWGRTTQLSRITERWFGVLSGRIKDLALRSDEFVGVVDKMRSQFGLLGLYMENSARIASVLGDVFKKNNVFLQEYGVEGVVRMTEGLAGFENRLKSNIGTFLFFSGALEKPLGRLSDFKDLWERTLKTAEEYKQGGVFSLAIKAYDKMVKTVGEHGAMFWLAQDMRLSVDQYPVLEKFIKEFKRISEGNEETGKLVAQYLKTGDRAVLKQLGERGVKIEDMEKLRKDIRGLSESLTDPLKRIEILIRDVVFHLAGVMAGLLKIIIGLLASIFFGVTFQRSKAREAFKYSFEGIDKVKSDIGKFVESVKKAGAETGDILLGLGDLFERLKKLETPPLEWALRQIAQKKLQPIKAERIVKGEYVEDTISGMRVRLEKTEPILLAEALKGNPIDVVGEMDDKIIIQYELPMGKIARVIFQKVNEGTPSKK